MLCIIYISGEIGCSVLGALAGELGLDDGTLFGMRFLPCKICLAFYGSVVCVFGFDMRWKIFEHR